MIVAARRTPFGRRGGALSSEHPHTLLAAAQRAALDAAGLDAAELDLVVTGCVTQVGEQAYNIGRLAALAAGYPVEVPGMTIDAQCGSSQQAVNIAAALVETGTADVVLASGVESMSRVPLGHARSSGPGDALSDAYRDRFEDISPGESAERIADLWGSTRGQCDAWALRSQSLAARARDEGRLTAEIAPIVTEDGAVDTDEGIRATSAEKLADLEPTFREDGCHTAASSSQLSDGAAAVLVMSDAAATRRGLEPMARIAGQAIVGVDPVLRLTGPIPVTRRLLDGMRMTADDIDLYEVNEAFASVVLAWLAESEADPERVNVNGGAIALGHPVGATGARLITTAAHELVRRGSSSALVAMCCGTGLGTGTVLVRD
jgi:acetyl-CoA acetyltransferase family protein